MAVSFSTYVERLSNLLMAAGRSAPRYEMMAAIYPRSKTIQSYMSEYFIVVVHLCHQILKFINKSAFGKLAAAFDESDIKNYEPQLEDWANMIKDEVTMLMAKKIEDEANDNSRFRNRSGKL